MRFPAFASSCLVALAASACGGSAPSDASDTFPTQALATLQSDSGHYSVEVRTSPEQPPSRGVASVQLVIRDVSGAPVDGLSLDAVPWMASMGHGTSVTPTVTAKGQGVYEVTNVYFFMPGAWQLRTDLQAQGSTEDHVTPDFQIP